MSYVGVSGVVRPEQQHDLHKIYREAGLRSHRDLLLGVKATEKTQWQNLPNKYGEDWYPVGDRIGDCLEEPWHAIIPTLQIYLGRVSGEDAVAFISRLHGRTRSWRGKTFQLDRFPWMEPTSERVLEHIERIRGFGGQTIIQAYGEYMSEYQPYELTRRLKVLQKSGLIDYVLFDASHGTGKTMDTQALRPFVGTTYEVFGDELGVAIAGGLDAQTVTESLPALVSEFPDLSWDAEGKLHHADGANGGRLKMHEAEDYLRASAEVISKVVL